MSDKEIALHLTQMAVDLEKIRLANHYHHPSCKFSESIQETYMEHYRALKKLT